MANDFPQVQIAIPCGINSSRYLKFLIHSILKTTPLEKFKLLIGVQNKCLDSSVISEIKDKVANVEFVFINHNTIKSSWGHAHMLNELSKKLSSQYSCFIDCDCAILKKNWIDLLIPKLQEDVVAIGSEYDGDKYMNFPNAIFCFFKSKIIKDLDICFLPKKEKLTISKEDSHIFFRDIGEKIFLDVGWEFPYKCITSGYKGISLPLISPRRKDRLDMLNFMMPDMRGEEHQIDGIPIVTHVGRSSSRSFDDPIVQKWRDRVLFWLDQK